MVKPGRLALLFTTWTKASKKTKNWMRPRRTRVNPLRNVHTHMECGDLNPTPTVAFDASPKSIWAVVIRVSLRYPQGRLWRPTIGDANEGCADVQNKYGRYEEEENKVWDSLTSLREAADEGGSDEEEEEEAVEEDREVTQDT
jgi:hypothetical protein